MTKVRILGHTTSQPNDVEIAKVDPFVSPEEVTINKEIDGVTTLFFRATLSPQGAPPPNQPPQITVANQTVNQHADVIMMAIVSDPDGRVEDVNWKQISGVTVALTQESAGDHYLAKFHAMDIGTYGFEVEAFDNNGARTARQVSVICQLPPDGGPQPGTLIYDSHVNSKLHDAQVRTITKEGDINPGKLGIECRASGSPKIVVNADGTFSLVCQSGHGRFYLYCRNYNAMLELEIALWKTASGQDISLKLRSRHNEPGQSCSGGSPIDGKRFGGYGCAPDNSSWNAKREPTHNCHDQSKSGSLPKSIGAQKFVILRFSVKDDGSGGVEQKGQIDYKDGAGFKTFMSKTDTSPKSFMVDKALYDAQSYLWVRQNIDSGSGELRIKSMKVFAL